MSRKPAKKSDEEKLQTDLPESLEEDSDHRVSDIRSEIDAGPDDEFDDEEFSLDQLSQAYAEVLKNNHPESDMVGPDSLAESESDDHDAPPAHEEKTDSDEDDEAACPIAPESIIESILFVGAPKGVKLTSRKVAAVLRDVSPKEVTKIVRDLNAKYEKEDAAYRIESDGGVFKMVVDPKLQDFQRDFFGRNREVRLSQAAIDVMAVVAYNQPVTKTQVEKIRSRPSGSVLAQLVRRELLNVEPGETDPKVKYYTTTNRFLDLFNLDEIADLPQTHEVSDIEELAD